MSRISNIKKNALYGIISNLLTMFISFATRTVFIYTLSIEYLGLNGLFSNILSILSLAELGIGNAITFSLYKPISENDENRICQLMDLYKKAYIIIGLIILILGILLMPFLNYFVNFENTISINYYVIYFLYLINTVCSYLFFSYKNTIIYANQKAYVTTKYEMISNILILIFQIIVLIFTNNYYLYLIIPIVVTLIKNYRISLIAKNMFPIIERKPKSQLDKKVRNDIFKNIYSLSLFKISSVVYTSTDNLVISTFLTTTIVGYYSNYLMIINMVKQFLNIIFNSMTASIGNINATESAEYKFKIFRKINLMNYFLYAYCFTCIYHLINPFITFWIGEKYVFSNLTVLLICITFLIPGLNNVINIYKDACGLFWETRYRALCTAVINLVVSVILVKYIGIDGILIGTIVAYLTTIYVIDPKIVFTKVFKKSPIIYYCDLLKWIVILFIYNVILYNLMSYIYLGGLIGLIVKLLIITSFFLLFYCCIFFKNDDFINLYNSLLLQIKNKQ